MEKDLIVTIFAPTKNKNGSRREANQGKIGTGFPIAEDLILTSRHVIKPDFLDEDYPIKVLFYYTGDSDKGNEKVWLKIKPEDIVWCGEGNVDAALIRCPFPEAAQSYAFGMVSANYPAPHKEWESAGFARVNRRDEMREPEDFSGSTLSMASKADYFDVEVTSPPAKLELWKGASGMPIFCDGEIIGVVSFAKGNFNAKKLKVTPTCKMLEDKIFCKHLGIDERREFLEQTLESISRVLRNQDSKAVRDIFTNELKLEVLNSSEKIANALLAVSVNDFFSIIEKVRKKLHIKSNLQGLQVIGKITEIVLPVLINPVQVESLRQRKSDVSITLFSLPVSLRSVAEIIMAGMDRRAAKFRPLDPGDEWPMGELALPQLPDGGRDRDGSQFGIDFEKQLENAFKNDASGGFVTLFDEYMRDRFIGESMQSRLESAASNDINKYINARLKHEQKNGKTYYFLVTFSNKNDPKKQVIAKLKKQYSFIVFLELSNDMAIILQEQETYSALSDIVTPSERGQR